MIEMKIVKWEKFKMKTRGRLKLKFRAKLKKSLWTREDMLGRVGK